MLGADLGADSFYPLLCASERRGVESILTSTVMGCDFMGCDLFSYFWILFMRNRLEKKLATLNKTLDYSHETCPTLYPVGGNSSKLFLL